MDTTEALRLIGQYGGWLASKMTCADIAGIIEITTPFLDRHNDRLQVYLVPKQESFCLTDDGHVVSDLLSSGFNFTDSRKKHFEGILRAFGVLTNQDNELYIEASDINFPQKLHKLLQGMLAINDMAMMSKSKIASIFLEDVKRYLDKHDVRYSPDVDFVGRSGLTHHFDYVIPKSNLRPERLIKAINRPSRDAATNLLFAWEDTKETRPAKAQAYAIINDSEVKGLTTVINSFSRYGITAIRWSEREQHLVDLSA